MFIHIYIYIYIWMNILFHIYIYIYIYSPVVPVGSDIEINTDTVGNTEMALSFVQRVNNAMLPN